MNVAELVGVVMVIVGVVVLAVAVGVWWRTEAGWCVAALAAVVAGVLVVWSAVGNERKALRS